MRWLWITEQQTLKRKKQTSRCSSFSMYHKKACWPNQEEDASKGSENLTVEYFFGVRNAIYEQSRICDEKQSKLLKWWAILSANNVNGLGNLLFKMAVFYIFAQFLVPTMDLTITVTKPNFYQVPRFFNRL